MTEFKFSVSYDPNVTLLMEDGEPRYVYDTSEDSKYIWLVDDEEHARSQIYEPTEEFWEGLISLDDIVDRLHHVMLEAEGVGVNEFVELTGVCNKKLPEYENRFYEAIYLLLVEYRMGEDAINSSFYPDTWVKRIMAEAYRQTDTEPPEELNMND